MEIALRTAGALLGEFSPPAKEESVLPDWVLADRPGNRTDDSFVDEFMGSMW
jgi:hypothetical protein